MFDLALSASNSVCIQSFYDRCTTGYLPPWEQHSGSYDQSNYPYTPSCVISSISLSQRTVEPKINSIVPIPLIPSPVIVSNCSSFAWLGWTSQLYQVRIWRVDGERRYRPTPLSRTTGASSASCHYQLAYMRRSMMPYIWNG